ncbi:MAG: MBL fold metallo-hydrolase [Desulfobacteraceae bacterium]|nr:MBL fold metallo-hydrolase [Desulfobacteraceae bacterium]MBC2751004.1 MBL fold metallo-hydrolase [Desulfobacteraceae bacterium]
MPHKPVEILPGLFFILRGYLNANHFALRSDRPVLVDTGYLGNWGQTEDILTRLGLDLNRVALIINTHTHCDHVGGNDVIQKRSGCDIALHPRGAGYMRNRDDRSPWWSYYHQEAAFFQPTQILEDGQVVHVGPHAFEVIHTPGHASDGIVLYNRPTRILLSSDTLWERDFPVMTLAVEGDGAIENMMTSLAKLAGLAVDQVYPGHGAPFDDFQSALQRAVTRLERFQADPSRVGWDVIKKIFVYTIMMKRRVAIDTFFDQLMQTDWFPDTVDRYFSSGYRSIYDQVITEFHQRHIIKINGHDWVTTVRP